MLVPAPAPRRASGTGARRTVSRPAAAVALAAGAALLAGCGGTGAADDAASTLPASPSPSPTSAPSSIATASSPSTAPAASASPRPAGLAGRLLGADQVPALGGVSTWTVESTGPAGPQPFGACQEYDFATIGAKSAVVRSYVGQDGPASTAAAERVVSFPDATNAARASKVLESFRKSCRQRVRGQLPNLSVSAARSVPVESGTASAYTVTWTPTDGSSEQQSGRHTEEIGTVLNGSLIAVVTLETDAARAASDSDPMPAALAAAARLLD